MKTLGIIPARWKSTRFPGKPLAKILNKPMIQWVYESCLKSKALDYLAVATDDERIREAVESFGGEAVMTSPSCLSGSDRVFEACQKFDCDFVLNIQGDEPLVNPQWIELLVQSLKSKEVEMATLSTKFKDSEDRKSIHAVKVVVNKRSEALYFSRLPIPFERNSKHSFCESEKHLGIYAYKKEFLEKFCKQDLTHLEEAEGLEQLRALYMGAKIKVISVSGFSCGVDVLEDIEKVENLLKKSVTEHGK